MSHVTPQLQAKALQWLVLPRRGTGHHRNMWRGDPRALDWRVENNIQHRKNGLGRGCVMSLQESERKPVRLESEWRGRRCGMSLGRGGAAENVKDLTSSLR